MNVILLQDVDNLGQSGEVVTVKNGYARNYLIPRGYALQATAGLLRAKQEETRQQGKKIAAAAEKARQTATAIEALTLRLVVRTGEDGRLFGSVTPQMIADALAQQGFEVDRRRITVGNDVKTTGAYTATAKLHNEVTATVPFEVVSENAPAAAPAAADEA